MGFTCGRLMALESSEGNEQTKTPQPKYVFPYCLPWGEFASGNGENFGLQEFFCSSSVCPENVEAMLASFHSL